MHVCVCTGAGSCVCAWAGVCLSMGTRVDVGACGCAGVFVHAVGNAGVPSAPRLPGIAQHPLVPGCQEPPCPRLATVGHPQAGWAGDPGHCPALSGARRGVRAPGCSPEVRDLTNAPIWRGLGMQRWSGAPTTPGSIRHTPCATLGLGAWTWTGTGAGTGEMPRPAQPRLAQTPGHPSSACSPMPGGRGLPVPALGALLSTAGVLVWGQTGPWALGGEVSGGARWCSHLPGAPALVPSSPAVWLPRGYFLG